MRNVLGKNKCFRYLIGMMKKGREGTAYLDARNFHKKNVQLEYLGRKNMSSSIGVDSP